MIEFIVLVWLHDLPDPVELCHISMIYGALDLYDKAPIIVFETADCTPDSVYAVSDIANLEIKLIPA